MKKISGKITELVQKEYENGEMRRKKVRMGKPKEVLPSMAMETVAKLFFQRLSRQLVWQKLSMKRRFCGKLGRKPENMLVALQCF